MCHYKGQSHNTFCHPTNAGFVGNHLFKLRRDENFSELPHQAICTISGCHATKPFALLSSGLYHVRGG